MGRKESDVTEQLSTKSFLNALGFCLISKRVNLQFIRISFFFFFNENISFYVLGKVRPVN